MELISYDGFVFATNDYAGGFPDSGLRGQWSVRTLIVPVTGGRSRIAGQQITPRRIPIEVLYLGTAETAQDAIDALLGALQPENATPRSLVAQRNDGTLVELDAVIELEPPFSDGPEVTVLPVTFVAADPVWREQAPAIAADAFPVLGPPTLAIPIANNGHATVNPLVAIEITDLDPGQGELMSRHTFTVTNNSNSPLNRYPLRVNLGDTTGWTFFNSGHSGANAEFFVYRDGLPVPRATINLDAVRSYCWIIVDDLAAGETAEYVIAHNGQPTGELVVEASGIGNINRPAFDISWESDTATAGTASTITRTGAGWQTNQWQHGLVEIIAGTGAGADIYQVVSNDDDTLTINGTFANGTPDSTSVYLVYMSGFDDSSNVTWWVYDIRQVERSDPERGLWYTSGAGQSPPQEVRFDTPGSWYPVSLLDNNDERVQKEVTPFIPGGGTTDYVTGLDANRTWQGGSSYTKGARKHDGVAFDSPVPIVSLRADFLLKNPNGMAKGFLGAKEGAGADYEEILGDTTASDTLEPIAANTYAFPADTHHLAIGLLPRNDQEIPLSWAEDSGTATSATSTTLVDTTKLWVADQWINAVVRIISGTGAGQARSITDSGPTSVTVSAWTTTPDTTSRYQIRQKSNDATFRGHEQWRLILDESDIVASAISAEADNFLFDLTLRLDADADDPTPDDQIVVGQDARRLMLAATEELRIDGTTRRVAVHSVSTGAKLRDLGGGYVRAEHVPAVGAARLAGDWLPLTPDRITLPNGTFDTDLSGWETSFATAGVTFAVTHDATVFGQAAGSMKLDITANTAGAFAFIDRRAVDFLRVTAGQTYRLLVAGRSSTSDLTQQTFVEWHDAAQGFLGFSSVGIVPPATAGVFAGLFFPVTAPANAAFARVTVRTSIGSAGGLGQAWWDDVHADGHALWVLFPGGTAPIGTITTVEWVQGYYG